MLLGGFTTNNNVFQPHGSLVALSVRLNATLVLHSNEEGSVFHKILINKVCASRCHGALRVPALRGTAQSTAEFADCFAALTFHLSDN